MMGVTLLSFALFGFSDAFQSAFVPRSGLQHPARGQSSSALCMSTIAVFGASGLTASECVYQALQNGDEVVGLTRYVGCLCSYLTNLLFVSVLTFYHNETITVM